MAITFEMEPSEVRILASGSTPLTEISFAATSGVAWMLGRGVHWIKGIATEEGRFFRLTVRAMSDPRPLAMSNFTTIVEMVRAGYFPIELRKEQQIIPGGPEVTPRDGNNRVSSNTEGTLTNTFELRPELALAALAFGVGDQFVGDLSNGATVVEWRGSAKLCQQWHNVGMTPQQAEHFARNRWCYDPKWTAQKIIENFNRKKS